MAIGHPKIVAELICDQSSRGRSLRFPHAVSIRNIKRDVQNVNAVKLRDTLGGGR